MSRQRAAALSPASTLHRFQILIHSSPRSALLAAASSRRSRWFVLRWFELNIDGDRIAGWKCVFQGLIEQLIQMRHRCSKRLAQTFWSKYHICGLSTFV